MVIIKFIKYTASITILCYKYLVSTFEVLLQNMYVCQPLHQYRPRNWLGSFLYINTYRTTYTLPSADEISQMIYLLMTHSHGIMVLSPFEIKYHPSLLFVVRSQKTCLHSQYQHNKWLCLCACVCVCVCVYVCVFACATAYKQASISFNL